MADKARRIVRILGRDSTESREISALDRGFMLGDGIFETVRVYRGRPFRLDAHLRRMAQSAAHFRLPFPAESIRVEISELIEGARTASGDARLRITLSRGVAARSGLTVDGDTTPTVALMLEELAAGAPGHAGESAVFAMSRRNELSASSGHKTVAFLDAIAELGRATDAGASECIFLDTQGHVSEAASSNVFIFDGESLITPSLGCGALPGITRGVVLEMAQSLSIPVEERVVEKEELMVAREVFLTSSVREIVPLLQLDSVPIGNGREGELTCEMSQRYAELARS